MKTRFYYTLAELFERADAKTIDAIHNNEGIYEVLNSFFDITIASDTAYTKKLWQEYLWPKLFRQLVSYIDVEHGRWEEALKPTAEEESFLLAQDELYTNLWGILNRTRSYYEPLIKMLEDNQNGLLDQIKSSSFNRFNDTPQAIKPSGGFGDDYATTTSKTETATDGGTLMSRLEEIRQGLRNYYEEWAKQFENELIIYGE